MSRNVIDFRDVTIIKNYNLVVIVEGLRAVCYTPASSRLDRSEARSLALVAKQ